MNSSLLIFVCLALLLNISVIFLIALFENMSEECLHITGHFDKYVVNVFPVILLY